MSEKEKINKEALLNKIKNSSVVAPDKIDGVQFEGNGVIGEEEELDLGAAIEFQINDIEKDKERRKEKIKAKVVDNLRKKKEERKTLMIKPGKSSDYNTRSDDYMSEPMRAMHVILNRSETEVYKDGVDPCPRKLMGISAWGKRCLRGAFEHLHNIQKTLKEKRGDDPENAVPWIIISTDTDQIADRNLITRLEGLQMGTGMAAPYGFEMIRASGRWYDVTPIDQERIRGCYVQAKMDSIDTEFIVGHRYKQSPRYRIIIAHGPFVAIRGSVFNKIDFSESMKKYGDGYNHYMADLSMECLKRGYAVAAINSLAFQFQDMRTAIGTPEFESDQKVFTARWQKLLPAAIPTAKKA